MKLIESKSCAGLGKEFNTTHFLTKLLSTLGQCLRVEQIKEDVTHIKWTICLFAPIRYMDTHILAMIFNANIFVPTLNYKEAYMFVNIRHKYPLSVQKKKKVQNLYLATSYRSISWFNKMNSVSTHFCI